MTSNLLIGYNQVARNAIDISASTTSGSIDIEALFPIDNLRGGFRTSLFKTRPNPTDNLSVVFKTRPSPNHKAANFIFIPRLYDPRNFDWFDTDTLFKLYHSADGTTYTAIASGFVGYDNAVNANNIDLFTTFDLTSQYQYWKVEFTETVENKQIAFGHVMLGEFLDLSADWASWNITTKTDSEAVQTDTGSYFMGKIGEPKKTITARWEGVTRVKLADLENKILKFKDYESIILYATNKNFIIEGLDLIHCTILTANISKTVNADFNIVELVLQEL